MADNKRNTFLKGLLGKISGGLKEVPHLNEIQKMRQETGETDLKTKKMKKELVDKMMARYPSSTTIGTDTWGKRKREVADMVKDGRMKQARDFIEKKRKEYEKLNDVKLPK